MCHAIIPPQFNPIRNFMNKAQFAELVQQHGGYASKTAADAAIDAVTAAITEALSAKEDVALPGFGSFKTATQAAKEGKIPGTDKMYSKPATTVAKFTASSVLKEKVAGN
jgi:DNA-binding protein HU-beta